jgi:hypothetical protein
MAKREIKIKVSEGVCETEKFQKLLEKGQIVSEKVEEHLNEKMTFVGSAKVEIKTDDKEFTVNYYVTKEGLILQSGSDYLWDSKDNIEIGEEFTIKKVKTKKGHTYIFNPIFNISDLVETENDLPF